MPSIYRKLQLYVNRIAMAVRRHTTVATAKWRDDGWLGRIFNLLLNYMEFGADRQSRQPK